MLSTWAEEAVMAEQCGTLRCVKKIWGSSPAETIIKGGIETADVLTADREASDIAENKTSNIKEASNREFEKTE